MPKRLIIVGAGEFAEIACAYFDADDDCDIVAFGVASAPFRLDVRAGRRFSGAGGSTRCGRRRLGARSMNRKRRFGERAVVHDVYAWMR